MKVTHIVFVICSMLIFLACSKSTEPGLDPSEVQVQGVVMYFIDSLTWIGGECDPSGFILSNYQWIRGEPTFRHDRIYLKDSNLAPYVSAKVLIRGLLDTISAGGYVTPLRRFPLVEVKSIRLIREL